MVKLRNGERLVAGYFLFITPNPVDTNEVVSLNMVLCGVLGERNSLDCE